MLIKKIQSTKYDLEIKVLLVTNNLKQIRSNLTADLSGV